MTIRRLYGLMNMEENQDTRYFRFVVILDA